MKKDNTTFLGIVLDSYLNWKVHIQSISSSISRGIGILYKLKNILTRDVLIMLYNTLILPYISYCNSVWGHSSDLNTNRILRLQKKALRICTGSHYLANTDPLFYELHTLKIKDINIFQTSIFMFKFKSKLLPETFDKMFTYNSNIHKYPTRIANDFHLTNPRLLLSHKSMRHHGPDIWNSLPEATKNSPSINSFKTNMKKYMLSKYTSHSIQLNLS